MNDPVKEVNEALDLLRMNITNPLLKDALDTVTRCAKLGATLEGKKFPIQGDYREKIPSGWVPWEVGMRAYAVWAKSYGRYSPGDEEYAEGKGIADRGGFGYYEMDKYTGSQEWRKHFRVSR